MSRYINQALYLYPVADFNITVYNGPAANNDFATGYRILSDYNMVAGFNAVTEGNIRINNGKSPNNTVIAQLYFLAPFFILKADNSFILDNAIIAKFDKVFHISP